jgi:hypothetical protein
MLNCHFFNVDNEWEKEKSSLNFKLPLYFFSCMCLCLNLYRFLFLLFYARHIRSHKSDRTDPIRERTRKRKSQVKRYRKSMRRQTSNDIGHCMKRPAWVEWRKPRGTLRRRQNNFSQNFLTAEPRARARKKKGSENWNKEEPARVRRYSN